LQNYQSSLFFISSFLLFIKQHQHVESNFHPKEIQQLPQAENQANSIYFFSDLRTLLRFVLVLLILLLLLRRLLFGRLLSTRPLSRRLLSRRLCLLSSAVGGISTTTLPVFLLSNRDRKASGQLSIPANLVSFVTTFPSANHFGL
jgi:hypothetical protein